MLAYMQYIQRMHPLYRCVSCHQMSFSAFAEGGLIGKSMTCTRCRGLIDGCFRLFDIVLTRTLFAAGCAGIYIYIYTHTCNKHPAGPSQGMIIHFDQWLLSCFAWALSFSCCFCILSSDFSMQGFLHACQADLLTACEAFCSEADARISAVRQRALLALAVAFLQHFVRANWTGPPEQAGGKKPPRQKIAGTFFGVEKKQRKIMIFLWLQGLMSLKTYRFTVKSW